MCGICGIAGADPSRAPMEDRALRAMTDAIVHRGPDEEGRHAEPGVSLGMRRLSIIDLPGSSQPLSNEDGTVWTVFNGEIYNYRELRRDLERAGHRFQTQGDTETIVHLYEEHGLDFVRRLRGMFAIALWDRPRRRLVLVRDRMGVKPLYFTRDGRGLAFASEVKSLIAGGIVKPALDHASAELFMAYGYVPGPATLFAGVRKVMPASMMVWEDGDLVSEREYWSPEDDAPVEAGVSWESDQERLLELLRSSVKARMISDVPLGAMLSGGLDSSLITALMSEVSTHPVETFSIGFAEDAASNELDDARFVAERLGTNHHEILTSAVDHPDLLEEALWHLEEPIADLSCLGFLLLSRLARESVTVALSGQGADEILGGYRKHQIAAAAAHLAAAPAPLRKAIGSVARLTARGSTADRGLRALTTSDPAERMLAMSRIVQPEERARLFSDEFREHDAESMIAAPVREHVGPRRRSVLAEVLLLDSKLALVDNMFLYFDKMSMATSLEVRVPFMDHDVVTFCNALPDSRRVWMGRRKELLKRASRGLVDDRIIRKKKRGFFHAALGAWLDVHRQSLMEELFDPRTVERGLYRADTTRALVVEAGRGEKKIDQSLFCLFLLEKWMRLYVDPDGPGGRLAASAAEDGLLDAA